MKAFKVLLFAALFLGGFYYLLPSGDPFLSATPGMIEADPVQTPDVPPPFAMGNFRFFKSTYRITPLARYDIKARVLAKARYYSETLEGDIVPYDFGLGWQAMSNTALLSTYFEFKHVAIPPGARLLRAGWRYDKDGHVLTPPAQIGNIQVQYSNNHLIPANSSVLNKLSHVKVGNLVHLTGYLVKVEKPDVPGWEMTSSTSRDDTTTHWGGNNNNCEVMYVTEAAQIVSTDPYLEEPLSDGWLW